MELNTAIDIIEALTNKPSIDDRHEALHIFIKTYSPDSFLKILLCEYVMKMEGTDNEYCNDYLSTQDKSNIRG